MAEKKRSISSREGQGGRIPEGGMGYTGPGSDYLSGSVTSASRSSIVEEPTETLRIREKEKIHKQIGSGV